MSLVLVRSELPFLHVWLVRGGVAGASTLMLNVVGCVDQCRLHADQESVRGSSLQTVQWVLPYAAAGWRACHAAGATGAKHHMAMLGLCSDSQVYCKMGLLGQRQNYLAYVLQKTRQVHQILQKHRQMGQMEFSYALYKQL